MSGIAARLAENLVEAFAPYVRRRIIEQGLSGSEVTEDSLAQGKAWLSSTLDELLKLPFAEQPRGPLEVFQEAMKFPTEALEAAGAPTPLRDSGAMEALPGDKYDLAPASSRLLGEEVWMAHLAWGAAKARDVGRPRLIALRSDNLMDRSRIEPLVVGSGGQLVDWDGRSVGSLQTAGNIPDLVLVDLAWPGALATIEELHLAEVRVFAYGPHVEAESLRRARHSGADEVLARSAFFVKLGDLLS